MPNEHVALNGKLYAAETSETILNTSDFQIADFRRGYTLNMESTFAESYGQSIVRKQAVLTLKGSASAANFLAGVIPPI